MSAAGTYTFQKAVDVFQLPFQPWQMDIFKKQIYKFPACSWEFHVVGQWVTSVVLPRGNEWRERWVGLEGLKRSLLTKKICLWKCLCRQSRAPVLVLLHLTFLLSECTRTCMSKREVSGLMQGHFGFGLSLSRSFNQNIFSLFIYYSKQLNDVRVLPLVQCLSWDTDVILWGTLSLKYTIAVIRALYSMYFPAVLNLCLSSH